MNNDKKAEVIRIQVLALFKAKISTKRIMDVMGVGGTNMTKVS